MKVSYRAAGAVRDQAGVIRQGNHVEGVKVEQGEQCDTAGSNEAAGGAGRKGTQAGDAEGDFGGGGGVEVDAQRGRDSPDHGEQVGVIELAQPEGEDETGEDANGTGGHAKGQSEHGEIGRAHV